VRVCVGRQRQTQMQRGARVWRTCWRHDPARGPRPSRPAAPPPPWIDGGCGGAGASEGPRARFSAYRASCSSRIFANASRMLRTGRGRGYVERVWCVGGLQARTWPKLSTFVIC